MLENQLYPRRSPLREAITAGYLRDEAECVDALLARLTLSEQQAQSIHRRALDWVTVVRASASTSSGIEAFLHEYDLSSAEGIALMCLAEALLRIPDDATTDRLIHDKLGQGNWSSHLGQSHSLFVNASTWGLILTGRMAETEKVTREQPDAWLKRLVARAGESVVRTAMRRAMRILGQQFVLGETIDEAIKRSTHDVRKQHRYSYDMLGEAALTQEHAEKFYGAYESALAALAAHRPRNASLEEAPSLSVKLSALHPRYHFAQRERVLSELTPRLLSLAQQAMYAGITLTIDAEESDRLELSLDVFEAVYRHASLQDWQGFGLAVQAYQKRAPEVLYWLADLALTTGRRIPVRLVKGAYWDSEIKRAQEQGLNGYPVYTRKVNTDLAYLACAAQLLASPQAFYAQFATHNAHTLAFILEIAGPRRDFELQRLHGMGESLHERVLHDDARLACRVYAPVGHHRELLPYLVRRMLENGANASFVNRIADPTVAIDALITDPLQQARQQSTKSHPRIPLPKHLFGTERINSSGVQLADEGATQALLNSMQHALAQPSVAGPIIDGRRANSEKTHVVRDPSDQRRIVGQVTTANETQVDAALDSAFAAAPAWSATSAHDRATLLERAATFFEHHRAELTALCVREAGRSVPDALAEVREAVDFCRYYATQARQLFATPRVLSSYTGEKNSLSLHGRGVFACISPWNFPLAIFTGQITAALAAGNTVIAKPAAQTPLIATRTVELLHEAGIPTAALHLLPGSGSAIGSRLALDSRIAGIAFTGSTQTARAINALLAQRPGPIVSFIAETGGQNAMIVDSSALLDQVVIDVMQSAFNSAGQRCSALRVLFVQKDVMDKFCTLLRGAMEQLRVGNPALLSTDVGPIIDETARGHLLDHIKHLNQIGTLIARASLAPDTSHGCFVAPCAYRIDDLALLKEEVFGPILHVIEYRGDQLDEVIRAINTTGYGLTLGIHSRIATTIETICQRVRVGNIYVNRNMIGAVVGVQPFGGEGLSGTGPKAGGPHYLLRFATERTLTINTAASGGNTDLLALGD